MWNVGSSLVKTLMTPNHTKREQKRKEKKGQIGRQIKKEKISCNERIRGNKQPLRGR